MIKFIRHLKTKPEEVRKQYVLIALTISMSLVVLVWLSTLGVKKEKIKIVEEASEETTSPFSILSESFTGAIGGIKESIQNVDIGSMKENFDQTTENPDEKMLTEEEIEGEISGAININETE